ncbi:MAG: class I SAM-dependent methyltransferase [Acidimicrobiales bacterium]
MSAGRVHARDLDDFVAECDRLGGVYSPDAASYIADFELEYDTPVDDSLDGFSPEYEAMQHALYRELSGREIDQVANEQMSLDVEASVRGANPYGSTNVDHLAHHARTILTSILVSDLPPGARVLDMGCGWGVSTEMFGFCGCRVHAVDINPAFVEVVARRGWRGHPVTTEVAAFDAIATDERFDLVFFYESLHHAIRPWELLARCATLVKPDGKVTIAGEPVQSEWWREWGLRLGATSVYGIRKFGWFESGWSEPFLAECFRRAGLQLTMMAGIGLRHSAIGVAVPHGSVGPAPSPHWAVPPSPVADRPSVAARLAHRAGRAFRPRRRRRP